MSGKSTTSVSRKKKYFENLDALRFVSFFFIFYGHALGTESAVVPDSPVYGFFHKYVVIAGKTGFSFAFVLSSYINTWVILEENRWSGGNFKPLKYYVRRALRIWPLYYLVLFIGFVIVPYVKQLLGEAPLEAGNPLYFIFFIGNFFIFENGWPQLPIISVLWSVSVEEQFYIFWPFLLILFRFRIRWLFWIFIAVFFIATPLLFDPGRTTHNGQGNIWFHTLFLLADIAVGALFAFISFKKIKPFEWLQNLNRSAILSIYILFWICLIFYQAIFEHPYFPPVVNLIIEKLVFAFLLGFFIFEQNFCKNSLYKFGNIRWLSFLGLISYGLFCFHEIGILIGNRVLEITHLADNVGGVLFIKPLIAFGIILPVAWFSYYHFEMKFLKLKRFFYS